MALKLLQAAGHEVTAFYLQIWFQEDFRNFWDACPWEDDLAVCEQVTLRGGTYRHTNKSVCWFKQHYLLFVMTLTHMHCPRSILPDFGTM